jgi:uncharacterized membrane protein
MNKNYFLLALASIVVGSLTFYIQTTLTQSSHNIAQEFGQLLIGAGVSLVAFIGGFVYLKKRK